MRVNELVSMVVAVVALGAACGTSADTKQGTKPAGTAAPGSEALPTLESVREEACACASQDCVDRVRAEMTIQRRHLDTTLAAADECLDAVGGGAPLSLDEALRALTRFKDSTCGCRDRACVESIEKELMEWAMKNLDTMKNLKPTKAQDEAANKIEDQMEECKAKAEGIARQKQIETALLKAQVDGLISALSDLDNQMKESERQHAAATSQADRDRVAARQAEIRRQQREAQARLDKVKAGFQLRCPPDQPLC